MIRARQHNEEPYRVVYLPFNSKQETLQNGGKPTVNMEFRDGGMHYNGVDTRFVQDKPATLGTIRFKLNSGNVAGINRYFFDVRASGGTAYMRFQNSTITFAGFSAVYLNNVATISGTAITGDTEYEITGIFTLIETVSNIPLGFQNPANWFFSGIIYLFEGWDYLMSASEVANLYSG